jgi:hypothetical protein
MSDVVDHRSLEQLAHDTRSLELKRKRASKLKTGGGAAAKPR